MIWQPGPGAAAGSSDPVAVPARPGAVTGAIDGDLGNPEGEFGSVAAPGTTSRRARGIGQAALLIGGLTIVARVLGFVRTVVFAGTVKTSCLSAAYVTANQVPNVVSDIVLGGALTAIVVPILAGPAERAASGADQAAKTDTDRISSALLTWTIVILVPVSLVLALAAGPVISLLMPASRSVATDFGVTAACARSSLVPIASQMLVAFAPQILLYGLAVVLYGILQSHRKFTAPALAPILSSFVVIGAYLLFVPLGGQYTRHVGGLPRAAELTLSLGTTAGVAALVLTALVPAWRLRLRWRPALRFPAGVARRATGLAGVGIAALVGQDASVLVVTRLANAYSGRNGAAVTVYSYGWQVFVSVYAVLAIPVAISAFPVLSARQGAPFDDAAAAATRATALASWLGAALLAAVALPVARAFPSLNHAVTGQFALALVAFAPGLVGYGLVACLSRVLLADGRNRVAALATLGGWLVVIVADVVVIPQVAAHSVVPALGLINTVGMTVSGIALLIAVGRARGISALRGAWRAIGAGLAGAVAGATAGLTVTRLVPVSEHWQNACIALLAGGSALAAFVTVVALLDGGDLRSVLARVRRREVA
ncbi:MAG TPA: lipid II flippase MurJ [Streptosporangiaceae bacterium]